MNNGIEAARRAKNSLESILKQDSRLMGLHDRWNRKATRVMDKRVFEFLAEMGCNAGPPTNLVAMLETSP